MALRAGRVGVNPSEVDTNGKIKGSGGSDLTPRVQKLETQVSTFEFRDNEGTPQYRVDSEGEWLDFSQGGGSDVYLPITAISEDTPTLITPVYTDYFKFDKAGCVVDNNILYVDYYFTKVADSGYNTVFTWVGSRQFKSSILIDLTENKIIPTTTAGGYTEQIIRNNLMPIGHNYRLIGMYMN